MTTKPHVTRAAHSRRDQERDGRRWAAAHLALVAIAGECAFCQVHVRFPSLADTRPGWTNYARTAGAECCCVAGDQPGEGDHLIAAPHCVSFRR
jgi:hypothetical protein